MRKNILISGASAGLGRGMAWEFARLNRNLALCARRLGQLEELRDQLLAAHPAISVVVRQLDVNDHERVFTVFDEFSAELGGLDRIIVNAGSRAGGPLGSGAWNVNKRTAETNFVSALAQCEAAVALMRARNRGHLVVISSISALRGFPRNLTTYAASKAGVLALAEGIRADTFGTPIRVSSILPGYIGFERDAAASARLVTNMEKGCRLLVRAIEREPARASVPRWPWSVLGLGMRVMPLRVVSRFGATAQLARETGAGPSPNRPY
jgi:NADP-dependent 3-hydroxy acid dehydrogenase YdfG